MNLIMSFLMNDGIRFRPRVLIDVSRIDMSLSVLGYNISMPIMLAPTALHKLAHPEGSISLYYSSVNLSSGVIQAYLWRFI